MHACMYVCVDDSFFPVSVESFVSLLRDGDWEIRLFVLVPFSICMYVCMCVHVSVLEL